jgi:hypothetical protein
MKLHLHVFVIFDLAVTLSGLAHHARETGSAPQGKLLSIELAPEPTSSPDIGRARSLERRQDNVATCGYISGNVSLPMTCGDGARCCFYAATGTRENWVSENGR